MSVPYPITPEEIKHAEAVLLGSLLLSPEQGTLVHTVLQPEDFSEDRHRLIYEALQAIPGSHALDSHPCRENSALRSRTGADWRRSVPLMMLKQQAESTTMSIEDQAYLLKQSSLHRMLMHVGEALHTHHNVL